MRRRYGEHVHVFPLLPWVYSPFWPDFLRRVDGDVKCPVCRLPYAEHPNHPDFDIPTLHVTCLGEPVKT